jgi:hemerythrin
MAIKNTLSKTFDMRAYHLFENHIYIVSNHAVARNPIFTNKAYCIRFLEKIDLYLGSICKILHYSLDQNQFQLMIKLNDRKSFCDYYTAKKKGQGRDEANIPHSSYIFSQAMANLQSSTAIHFNRKEGRTGALFARRYYKHLVESKEELDNLVDTFQSFPKQVSYGVKWAAKEMVKNRARWIKRKKYKKERNAAVFYKFKKSRHPILSAFWRINAFDLQGQFITLPPRKINRPKIINTPFFTPPSPP